MDNRRGATFMVLAMAAFAVEDAFIKAAAQTLPTGQILILLSLAGTPLLALLVWARGMRVFDPAALSRPVLLRNAGELVGTICFITALALVPLSTASAILQALPLAVTLGAALFLGETVGWRRWSAIMAGFAGVLLILRPGAAGFDPAALFVVGAVAALATRDLVTQRIRAAVGSLQLATWGVATLLPAGLILLPFGAPPVMPGLREAGLMVGVTLSGLAAYLCLMQATRGADVSFVAPFRYTRIVFALLLGMAVFGERPDLPTLAGAALIVASGLYTFARERRLSLARRSG